MSTTDELLEEMLEDAEEYATPVTDDDLQFWIDEHLRVISIPKNGVVAGVEGDKNVNKIKFGMNRYYHGFDMSTFSGRILYSNAKGNKNYYNITDMQTNGNTITFSWLVDADAVQYMGKTAFVVYLFKTQGSELRQKFYSTLATLNVLEGMEVDSAVPVEKQTDIIERMKEEISAYAEEVKKSLPADYTAMTEQVSSLKEDLKAQTDWYNAEIEKLNIHLKKAGYITDINGNKYKLIIKKGNLVFEEFYEEVKSDYLLDFDVRDIEVTSENKQYYTEKISRRKITMNNVKIENAFENGILNASYETNEDWPIDLSAGYSIEMAYRCKPTSGWYNVFGILKRNILQRHFMNFYCDIPYYTTTELKFVSTKFNLSDIVNENGVKLSELINESTDIIYAVITVSATCEIKVYINGYLYKEIDPPEDFIKHVDNLTKNTITGIGYYMRFGNPGNNMPDDNLFSYCKISRGVLNENEIVTNYKARYSFSGINDLEVNPGNIQLYPYSKSPIMLESSPSKAEYEVDIKTTNEGIVEVSDKYVKGKNIGSTDIHFKVSGTEISKNMKVKVTEKLENIEIESKRFDSPEKVIVVNPPETLYVGDSWVLLGYLLPYEPKNDNLIVYTSDNPGVCSVEFGVLTANSKGTATITATGVNTDISTSFVVNVSKKIEEISTLSNTYYVPLPITTDNGFLDPNNDNAIETTHAIIDLLAWAKEKGYRKVVFPKGEYLVTPEVSEVKNGITGTIFMPDNMIVDFSDSIINVKPTDISKDPGYILFVFDGNIKNTILCNADIRGDRYTNTTEALDEQCKNIYIRGAIGCGVENCSIGNCGGFNIGFGRSAINKVSDSVGIYNDNIEAGTFTETGEKDDVNVSNNWRTINKLNISPLHGYFELGTVWGYAGYPIMARLYDMWIYNQSNELLEVKHNCRVFYRYNLPDNYYYADVVLHQLEKPSGNLDSGGMIRFYSLYEPYKCFMKNCKIHDNYSCGIAACGGKHWTLDGLIFENNGVRDPACHVDYEDGWESAIGDVWRNCSFDDERSGGIILVSGNSATFYNNEIKCKFDPRVRSENWRVYHNIISKSVTANCQTDTVIAQNILLNNAQITDGSHYHDSDTQYEVRDIDNYKI